MKVEIYLTVQEVAERVKVHPRTVQLWIRAGELKAAKLGRQWRIREEDLEEMVRAKIESGGTGDHEEEGERP